MKSKKVLSLLLAGAMAAVLLEAPAQAAEIPLPIRVSSYKGTTLTAGEISGLLIYPSNASYTVVSDNSTVVSTANVLGYWTATAQGPGTAAITISTPDGRMGRIEITVESGTSTIEDCAALDDSLELRQELIRLVNQIRRDNGVAELPVSNALMNAAQTISDKQYSWHHTQEECEAVASCGYPNGFGSNLTVFTGAAREDIAQRAAANWLNSPGHFQTMISPDCDSIGVGITESQGVTYCCLFIGKPNSMNPYR